MSGTPATYALRAPRELNGSSAVALLGYLGLSRQLLQVGIGPLLPQLGGR